MEWLKEEGTLSSAAVAETDAPKYRDANAATPAPNLAIFIKPLIVRDTQKWFGEAELRLDALVLEGGSNSTLYHPQTFRFPRVVDGDDLSGTEQGLLIYLGKPAHFICLSLILARDTADSDDLATLLKSGVSSDEMKQATSALSALALPAAPQLAAVQAGVGAALAVGDLAYKLVRATSPRCLGLYRASWLANKDRFGVGRHPRTGTHRVNDFDLGYEISFDA